VPDRRGLGGYRLNGSHICTLVCRFLSVLMLVSLRMRRKVPGKEEDEGFY
jgi:hypothetical protein